MSILQELFDNEVHIGHRTDRWNPKMRPYIYDKVNRAHIFDLEKTAEALDVVKKFLAAVKLKNGRVLFVGTKPQCSFVLCKQLEESKHFYVDEHWAPGLLTNFKEIRKRVDHYLNLKSQFASGEIKKYTKKEVSKFRKELDKLEITYHGVAEMRKKPDLVIVLDAVGNRLSIAEANKAGVPIVALVDANGNPDGIDYVIPGNDDSIKSVGFLLKSMLQSLDS